MNIFSVIFPVDKDFRLTLWLKYLVEGSAFFLLIDGAQPAGVVAVDESLDTGRADSAALSEYQYSQVDVRLGTFSPGTTARLVGPPAVYDGNVVQNLQWMDAADGGKMMTGHVFQNELTVDVHTQLQEGGAGDVEAVS